MLGRPIVIKNYIHILAEIDIRSTSAIDHMIDEDFFSFFCLIH
jgi:hypothetical protein